jgi:hypothetical protein
VSTGRRGVFAYFTAHSARTGDNHDADEHDTVRYACGELEADGNMLSGNLTAVFENTGVTLAIDMSGDVVVPDDGSEDIIEDAIGPPRIWESMEYRPRLSYVLKLRQREDEPAAQSR